MEQRTPGEEQELSCQLDHLSEEMLLYEVLCHSAHLCTGRGLRFVPAAVIISFGILRRLLHPPPSTAKPKAAAHGRNNHSQLEL